jgi:hypothetical protein
MCQKQDIALASFGPAERRDSFFACPSFRPCVGVLLGGVLAGRSATLDLRRHTVRVMTAAVFAFAASDWCAGTYLLSAAWQRRRYRRPLADRSADLSATPLADEVQRWLADQ